MKTVLFTGSRTVTNHDAVAMLLDGLVMADAATPAALKVVHGGARGLDHLVGLYLAAEYEGVVEVVAVPAEWERCGPDCPPTTSHRRLRIVPGAGPDGLVEETYCPWAGGRRNQLMLDEHKPDLVIAVVDKPLHLSKGTADMVKRAQKARVQTFLLDLTGGNP